MGESRRAGSSAPSDGGLGGRLPLVRAGDLNTAQRELYEAMLPKLGKEQEEQGFRTATEDGSFIGPFNSYLFVPEISAGYGAWIAALQAHSPLSPEVRQTVILAVGAEWRASYELYAHRAAAARIGMSPGTIDAAAAGRDDDRLSSDARVAQRFAIALVRHHEIDDGLYDEAKEAFGDAGLVALVHLVGLYLSVCAVLNAFKVPVPD